MKKNAPIALMIIASCLVNSCKVSNTSSVANTTSKAAITNLSVNTAPIDRNFYNALYEPKEGILHGAGQDIIAFNDYATTVGSGQHPIIYMSYVGLTRSKEQIIAWGDQLKEDLNKLPKDIMPQIGLNMTGGRDNGSGKVASVASGEFDSQITAFVQAIKKLDRKTFVRIGYEFEGAWNGYEPQAYVDSFIKITTQLHKENTNAATVWCSGGGSANFMPWEKLVQYYPGDQWVDWWGIDIFSPEEISDKRLTAFFKKANEYKKPIMIGETTPRHVGTLDGIVSWNKWFKPFFGLVYENPEIKAICYINWDWVYWSKKLGFQWEDWKDGRIEKNETISAAYIQELKKPIFIHSKGLQN